MKPVYEMYQYTMHTYQRTILLVLLPRLWSNEKYLQPLDGGSLRNSEADNQEADER
jgi:hypothetical protein